MIVIPFQQVRAYAVCILERADDDELQCYLLQLVQALRFERSDKSRLSQFLVQRCRHFTSFNILCVCVCTCTHAFVFTSFRLHFIYCSINLIVSELLQHHTILSWLAFSGGMFLWSFMILYMPNGFILHMRYWKKVWWRFDFLIIYCLNSCILWYTLMPKTFTGCVSFHPNFKDKFLLFRKLWHLIFFLFFYLLFKNYWDPWTILKEMGVCLLMFFFCCISVPQLRLASRLIWMAESYK